MSDVPEQPAAYGVFGVEEEETLDQRLAEEEPDPTQDPELFDTGEDDDDPVADLPEPEEFGSDVEPDDLPVEPEPDQ